MTPTQAAAGADATRHLRLPRISRRGALVAGLVILALVVLVLSTERRTGHLDPSSVAPDGSRAVANLLRGQGATVIPVTRARDAVANAGGATVLITTPGLVINGMVSDLLRAAPSRIVVLAGRDGDPVMDRLAAGVALASVEGAAAVPPGCDLRAAVQAGPASLPGLRYDVRGWGAQARGCYDGAEAAGVVELAARSGRPAVVLLGSDRPLTNEGLDVEGNAALALNLLGESSRVVWWQPSPDDPALQSAATATLGELIPPWVYALLLELVVGCAVLAVWRGRRLGRLVIEPLPVIVQAGETTSGHARLMQRNRARGEAAAQLRAAARRDLAGRVGLAPVASADDLVTHVATRSGRAPFDVGRLLYGPEPTTDAALVILEHELEQLITEVGHE